MLLLKLPDAHANLRNQESIFQVGNPNHTDSIFNALKEHSQMDHIKLPVKHSENVNFVQHRCSVRKNICATESVAVIYGSSLP